MAQFLSTPEALHYILPSVLSSQCGSVDGLSSVALDSQKPFSSLQILGYTSQERRLPSGAKWIIEYKAPPFHSQILFERWISVIVLFGTC